MGKIQVFEFEEELKPVDIIKRLNGYKTEEGWLTAQESKYNRFEVFLQYWYYEDVREKLGKILSKEIGEDEAYDIISLLQEKGKTRVLKRIYIYINTMVKTVEIYGTEKTDEILKLLKFLGVKPIILTDEQRLKFYTEHTDGKHLKISYIIDKHYGVKLTNERTATLVFGKTIFEWRPRFEIRQIVQIISNLRGE
jgi:hypothetical protein